MITDYLITILSSGVGVAITAYLAKKLLAQELNKEIIKYKHELKSENEKNKFKFEAEATILEKLWQKTHELLTICKNASDNNLETLNIINNARNELVAIADKHKPFIHDKVYEKIFSIIGFSSADEFKAEELDKIENAESELIYEIRNRMSLIK